MLWFPSPPRRPPHPHPLPDFCSRGLGTPFIQGPRPSAPAPIRPTSTPHWSPKTTAPRTLLHPMALLCGWVVAQPGYCLVQLPSTYFMHKQTTRWHWPGSSDNNVLPRSFMNTLSSPSSLTVNKGPLQHRGHLAL